MATTVLIVDDHELIRAGLRNGLQSTGDIDVVGEAASGAEAIAVATRVRPNVIILDIQLPDISGLELIPKIQKEETPASIKIDTEPAVQFSEMVSVFDERKSNVGEMRSIENPLDRPATQVREEDEDELLHIGQEVGGLDSADAEDLDNPGAGGIDD
jgi:chemotaxis response regulator CheB